MKLSRIAALTCVMLAASIPAARAQTVYTPSFDPEQYTHSADPNAISLLDGARPLGKGEYAVGLGFHLGGAPLTACVRSLDTGECLDQGGGDIVSSRFTSHLTGEFGFGRFDLRAYLPIVLNQGSDFDPEPGMSRLGSSGLTDLTLGGRVSIAQVTDFAFAFDLSWSIPLNGGDNFIGDPGMLVHPRAIADWRHDKFAAVASLGYLWREDSAQLANLFVNDELTWSVGGEYKINPKLSAGVSIFGRIGLMSDPNPMKDTSASPSSEERPAEFLLSSRYWINNHLAVEGGAGTGLSSGYGSANYRVLVALRWVQKRAKQQPPLVVDTDGDGINDTDDRCPRDPEDKDGFADADGCPDPDNDKDGIPDKTDKCPDKAEDKDGFKDEDGCPEDDDDKDGDGVPDKTDKCPNQPEDKDGFKDDDGCPDPDNDNDGILDKEDKCPNEAEDKDGFQDGDGCPDNDNDGDGIVDAKDKCPLQKEVYNGVDDEDGCPDKGKAIVVVGNGSVDVTRKIFFDLNKATIKRKSEKHLNVLVTALKQYSTIRIRIEGHTDDRGPADYNLDLSQRRANAVMAYLVKHGIAQDRLEAKGYGESRPLIKSYGRRARAKNRRVEFKIIGTGSSKIPSGTTTTPPKTTPAPPKAKSGTPKTSPANP